MCNPHQMLRYLNAYPLLKRITLALLFALDYSGTHHRSPGKILKSLKCMCVLENYLMMIPFA